MCLVIHLVWVKLIRVRIRSDLSSGEWPSWLVRGLKIRNKEILGRGMWMDDWKSV